MDKVSLIGLSVSCALIVIMLVLIKLKIKETSFVYKIYRVRLRRFAYNGKRRSADKKDSGRNHTRRQYRYRH